MNKSDVIQAKDIEKRMISFEIPSFFVMATRKMDIVLARMDI